MKRSVGLLLISLMLFSLVFAGVGVVSAADPQDPKMPNEADFDVDGDGDLNVAERAEFMKAQRLAITGTSFSDIFSAPNFDNFINWVGFQKFQNGDISGGILKYLFLILVFVLVYSALNYVKFPDNKLAQFILSLVVSVLAVIMVKADELTTVMLSYTAMGASLILFFPIFVLAAFTLVISAKMNPVGIVIQKILWVIYSVYLFVTSGAGLVSTFSDANWLKVVFGFFISNIPTDADRLILTILFVASIMIFYIAVVKNEFFVAWTAKEMRDADVEKYKDTAHRARAKTETDADMTRS